MVQIETRTIEERWAPPIYTPDLLPLYRSEAVLFGYVYDRIMELGQDTGVQFEILMSNGLTDLSKLVVYYGFGAHILTIDDKKVVDVSNTTSIPDAAYELARCVVEVVYE